MTTADETGPSESAAKNLPRRERAVWWLLLAAPALWTGWLIFHYGVDIPFIDQWDGFFPLLKKLDDGTLRLADFFAFHGEGAHRIAFPRLILFGLAQLTNWNVRAEQFVIWLLAGWCAANFWRLAGITGHNRSRLDRVCLFAACILLFTPAQLENWTWGIQVICLLPPACVTACLWIVPSLRLRFSFLLALVLCVVCTFSVASGLVCWFVVFPLLWVACSDLDRRRRYGIALLWWAAFLTCAFLYFRGYAEPASESGLTGFVKHPVKAAQFCFAYLGSAFANGTVPIEVPGRPASFRPSDPQAALAGGSFLDAGLVAQMVGMVLVAAVLFAAVHLWRHRPDKRLIARTLPWLMLAGYALLAAAVTTAGRSEGGRAQALSGRYLPFSVMLPIGLLFLVGPIFNHWRASSPDTRRVQFARAALAVMAALLALLHLSCSVKSLTDWREVQHFKLAGKALILLINVVDERDALERLTFSDAASLKANANFLDQRGFLRPPLVKTNTIRGLTATTPRAARDFGEILKVGQTAEGRTGMAGWALLPDKRRPADVVLLTCDDAQGESIIFAVAEVGDWQVKDGPALLKQRAYRQAGWIKVFDPGRLPAEARGFRAWAFDAEECRAYPIPRS